jgi:hypothetical protein
LKLPVAQRKGAKATRPIVHGSIAGVKLNANT